MGDCGDTPEKEGEKLRRREVPVPLRCIRGLPEVTATRVPSVSLLSVRPGTLSWGTYICFRFLAFSFPVRR